MLDAVRGFDLEILALLDPGARSQPSDMPDQRSAAAIRVAGMPAISPPATPAGNRSPLVLCRLRRE